MAGRVVIGVDVGGTTVKAGMVETHSGRILGPTVRIATPSPPLIGPVIETVGQAVEALGSGGVSVLSPVTAIGVGLPGDVRDGRHTTGANLDPGWVDAPARELIQDRLQHPVHIINDADAAGIAEIRLGAGVGVHGVVLLLTFGTGIGSAIFLDGRLLPNSGFGQFPFHGSDVELNLSAVARDRRGIGWRKWAAELDEFLRLVDGILRPDLVIIGGGASEGADNYWPYLRPPCPIARARFAGLAGVVGAALVAVDADAAGASARRGERTEGASATAGTQEAAR